MNKIIKGFLKNNSNDVKKQDAVLEKIEKMLHEMKQIAEYIEKNKLTSLEVNQLND